MKAFPFSSSPTQEVILPTGGTAVVRVVRGNEPTRPDNPLRLNGWMTRSLLSRITWMFGASRSSAWRVEAEAPSLPDGYWSTTRATRTEADNLASQVLDSLRRTGDLPVLLFEREVPLQGDPAAGARSGRAVSCFDDDRGEGAFMGWPPACLGKEHWTPMSLHESAASGTRR